MHHFFFNYRWVIILEAEVFDGSLNECTDKLWGVNLAVSNFLDFLIQAFELIQLDIGKFQLNLILRYFAVAHLELHLLALIDLLPRLKQQIDLFLRDVLEGRNDVDVAALEIEVVGLVLVYFIYEHLLVAVEFMDLLAFESQLIH